MEIVQQLQVELGEAMQRKEMLKQELLAVASCIDVFSRELALRKN